jgi:hypothetical protein
VKPTFESDETAHFLIAWYRLDGYFSLIYVMERVKGG